MAAHPPGDTFYWHDYETTGIDLARDRPLQFAGLRTDLDLNPIGEPLTLFCQPATDMLPAPEACLITGITPQRARDEGVCEAEFIDRILAELARPDTCALGYNTLRFDDEVTRHALYRNLHDPYAREWRDGNSRWDLIDLVRTIHALRPEGIEWPRREDGTPSFRLEELTAANNLEHGPAHDALADVRGTLALARLLRARQPRLWDYLFNMRRKQVVWRLLDLDGMTPLVHVSGRYPAARGCLAVVAPVARHPQNPNAVIVLDLATDPACFDGLDSDAIAERVFTAVDALPDGVERIPLKQVKVNRCPVLAPLKVLRPDDAARLGIDMASCERHLETLRQQPDLAQRVAAAFAPPGGPVPDDPDDQLYAGPFLGDDDRRRLAAVRMRPPTKLGDPLPSFDDPRLPEMVFRYGARNWPESLDATARADWEAFRRLRLTDPVASKGHTLPAYFSRIAELRSERVGEGRTTAVLDALEAWGRELEAGLID
ncbi:MAG: exodeoxyribonuclease I [Gammaproteobacteria bacterium]|nr:MAG: exodeoxyribonuclease I [Gammaproteobacteria bacterium]